MIEGGCRQFSQAAGGYFLCGTGRDSAQGISLPGRYLPFSTRGGSLLRGSAWAVIPGHEFVLPGSSMQHLQSELDGPGGQNMSHPG